MKTKIIVCVGALWFLLYCNNHVNQAPMKLVDGKTVTEYETKHIGVTGKSMSSDDPFNATLIIQGQADGGGSVKGFHINSGIEAQSNSSSNGCSITDLLIVLNDDQTRKCAVHSETPIETVMNCNLDVRPSDTLKLAATQKVDGVTKCGYYLKTPIDSFSNNTKVLDAVSSQLRCAGIQFEFFGNKICLGAWFESMVHIRNFSGVPINVEVKNSALQLFRWERRTINVGETFSYEIDTPWAQEWLVLTGIVVNGNTVDLPDVFKSVMFITGGTYTWNVTPVDLSPVSNIGNTIEFFNQVISLFKIFG